MEAVGAVGVVVAVVSHHPSEVEHSERVSGPTIWEGRSRTCAAG